MDRGKGKSMFPGWLKMFEKITMKSRKQALALFIEDESGQDLMEYAIVAALIGVGAIAALTNLSGKIGNAFNAIGNSLAGV